MVFLKVLPSNFTDLESRSGVALLTVLLSFWYLLNYWTSSRCVIFCCLSGCPALSSMHLVYFFSKSAFNLLWIFISHLSVFPSAIFKQSFPHTSPCQRWFCCWEGPFSINPTGGTSSLFTKYSSLPSGGTYLLKSGLCCVTRVAFVCIVKMLVWEDPCFLTVHWKGLCVRMMPQLKNLSEILSTFAVPRPVLKTVVLPGGNKVFLFSSVLNTPPRSVFLAGHYVSKLSASVQLHDTPQRSRWSIYVQERIQGDVWLHDEDMHTFLLFPFQACLELIELKNT